MSGRTALMKRATRLMRSRTELMFQLVMVSFTAIRKYEKGISYPEIK
jgi:hypothetical protein